MRRIVLFVVVLALTALGARAAGADPGNTVATGHGTVPRIAPFFASFRFAAEGRPDESAHGFYTQTLASPSGPSIFGNFSGDVTCLVVLDDTAVIGGVVTETTDPRFTAGWDFWVSVHDGRETNTPDSTSLVELSNIPDIEFGPGFPTTCEAPFLTLPPFAPVSDGQITVVP